MAEEKSSGPDEGTGLYDVKRLASRLQVQPASIRSMRRRNQLPEPLSTAINGGAVWSASSIHEFLASGRHSSAPKERHRVNPSLPRVIDLFSGCGGLTLGFQAAGWDVLAGFDDWPDANRIYNENINHEAFELDLSDLRHARPLLRSWMTDASVVIGGPPCQDFSSAGKRVEGDRADLTEKFADLICYLQPIAFVMENVEAAKNAFVFKRATETMRRGGFGVTQVVLDSSLCGVPQRRKRLFTVGILEGSQNGLQQELTSGLSDSPMTLREYFGNSLGLEYYYRHPRSYARRGIFSIDEPSPTIRGVNRPVPPGYPGHPGDPVPVFEGLRPLTTEERARVQTFPVGFWFGETKTAAEQMIGNAVPVNLAHFVAARLARFFSSETKD